MIAGVGPSREVGAGSGSWRSFLASLALHLSLLLPLILLSPPPPPPEPKPRSLERPPIDFSPPPMPPPVIDEEEEKPLLIPPRREVPSPRLGQGLPTPAPSGGPLSPPPRPPDSETPTATGTLGQERNPTAREFSDTGRARGAGQGEQPGGLSERLLDFRRALKDAASSPSGGKGSDGGQLRLAPLPRDFGWDDLLLDNQLQFESPDFDWSDYARSVLVELNRTLWRITDGRRSVIERWAYRAGVFELGHQARLAFTIERNGQVTGIVLERPSGCEPLDDIAVAVAQEVVLPPLPAAFPRDRERVRFIFTASGGIREIFQYLDLLKRLGFY